MCCDYLDRVVIDFENGLERTCSRYYSWDEIDVDRNNRALDTIMLKSHGMMWKLREKKPFN